MFTLARHNLSPNGYNLWLSLLYLSACQPSPEGHPYSPYKGHFDADLSCDYRLVVDIMAPGYTEPVILPDVNPQGQFNFAIPDKYLNAPLSIHGFCYSSAQEFTNNQSTWQTEPYLLIPKDGSKTIVLTQKSQRNEPAISEVNPSEWTEYATDPKLVQFYGLRHPDHQKPALGEQPEIRAGGLTVQTTRTHLWSIFSALSNVVTPEQKLLLPSKKEMLEIDKIEELSDPRFLILQTQLVITCSALEVPCPSINLLRTQRWIPKDKTFLKQNDIARHKAMLWLFAHHLFIKSIAKGTDASSYLPEFYTLPEDPTSKLWKEQIESVVEGYTNLGIIQPIWSTQWINNQSYPKVIPQ